MDIDTLIVRILLGLLMCGAVLFGPWWMILILGAIGSLFFSWYIEIVIAAFLIEALYNPSLVYTTLLYSLLVMVGIYLFKKILRRDTITL